MALIACPECSKEISDKVKNCPHCGYPFVEDSTETQKVEVTSIKLKMVDEKKKRLIRILISIIIIGISAFGSYYLYTTEQEKIALEEYKTNLDLVLMEMLNGGAKSEDLASMTKKVWKNAIYKERDTETDKYTRKNGYWVSDFNEALGYFFSDNETKETINKI